MATSEKRLAKLLLKSSRKGSFSSNASVQAEGSGSGCVTSKSGVPPGIPEKATLAAVRVGDLRLVLVNFVVAGLEVAASVAFTFIPPLLLKSGYSETEMSIIFGIAPLIALYTVPMIGNWSDVCTSRWGRRRPFILGLSLFLIISLGLLCFGQAMVNDPFPEHNYVGMCVVAFAVILLDYASQAAINPCESLMADMLSSANNANTGFMIYSAMLSLGSCVGYLLSAVDWQSLGQDTLGLGSSDQTAILIVLILFSITLIVTMITARERPFRPQTPPLASCSKADVFQHDIDQTLVDPDLAETSTLLPSSKKQNQLHVIPSFKCLDVRSIRKFICNSFRLSFILACLFKAVMVLLKPLKTVYEAPLVLRRLFWADLLCWMALMAHSMFCTDYVATVVYGGSAYAERGSMDDVRFDEGVRMGSLGLLLHSTTACIFSSFVQDSMANLVGLKTTYIFGLTMFGISMLFTVIFPSVVVLNVCAAFSGLGFAVATTIPCTLITKYHDQPEVYFKDTRGVDPETADDANAIGVGGDMAILDSTYYLSQIILSAFMGKIVEMTGLPHFYIGTASICGFLSAAFATRVTFSPSDYNKAVKG